MKTAKMSDLNSDKDFNRDPITGEPGCHPIGTGLGTAAGASAGAAGGLAAATATGAALGSAVGPVGTAVGAAAGAIVGGLIGASAGRGLAEMVNPTAEEAYWRDNFSSRPYARDSADFDSYRPAYRYGYDSYGQYPDRNFDAIEGDLQNNWEKGGNQSMNWDSARPAVRDSYERTGRVYNERLRETETV